MTPTEALERAGAMVYMDRPSNPGPGLARALRDLGYELRPIRPDIDDYREALIWASGADDFQVGGKAREGFERIMLPLLRPIEQAAEAADREAAGFSMRGTPPQESSKGTSAAAAPLDEPDGE